MPAIHCRHPHTPGWFLRHLRDNQIRFHDAGFLENLFWPDRIAMADESLFLTSDEGTVISLGVLSTTRPEIISYYTIPDWRGKGYGYAILVASILRIIQSGNTSLIAIEPISEGSEKHISRLPDSLKSRLRVSRPA